MAKLIRNGHSLSEPTPNKVSLAVKRKALYRPKVCGEFSLHTNEFGSAPMVLRLFNTRTRRIETFAPIDPSQVRMYCCGPTVYAFAHVGNLRTYVFEDILRRTLELFGYPSYM